MVRNNLNFLRYNSRIKPSSANQREPNSTRRPVLNGRLSDKKTNWGSISFIVQSLDSRDLESRNRHALYVVSSNHHHKLTMTVYYA